MKQKEFRDHIEEPGPRTVLTSPDTRLGLRGLGDQKVFKNKEEPPCSRSYASMSSVCIQVPRLLFSASIASVSFVMTFSPACYEAGVRQDLSGNFIAVRESEHPPFLLPASGAVHQMNR